MNILVFPSTPSRSRPWPRLATARVLRRVCENHLHLKNQTYFVCVIPDRDEQIPFLIERTNLPDRIKCTTPRVSSLIGTRNKLLLADISTTCEHAPALSHRRRTLRIWFPAPIHQKINMWLARLRLHCSKSFPWNYEE